MKIRHSAKRRAQSASKQERRIAVRPMLYALCAMLLLCAMLSALCAMLSAPCAYAADTLYYFQTITPGNTPTGMTPPSSGYWATLTITSAMCTVEDNSLMFCYDGSTPTAAAGTNICHRIDAGQGYEFTGAQAVRNVRFIDRVAGSAGKAKCTIKFGGE